MRFRQLAALLAAALLSALAPTLLSMIQTTVQIEEPWNIVVVSQMLSLARATFLTVLAHALVLGLPLFLLLQRIRRAGILACAIGGFFVGATPTAVLSLTTMFRLQNESFGDKTTVVNGVPTLWGWIHYAETVGIIGLFGVAGGLTFWAAMRLSGQAFARSKGNDPGPRNSVVRLWSAISTAVLLAGATILLPSVVKDDSCHNLFRDGRTSIVPQLYAVIDLTSDDWPVLVQIFEDFGAAHSLSLRNDKQIRDETLIWQGVNLCNEAGVNIDAVDQPWLAAIGAPPVVGQGLRLSVYELKAGSGWSPVTRDLLDRIDAKWPGRTTFQGKDGKDISMQDALKGRE